jgi:hypothetical protein
MMKKMQKLYVTHRVASEMNICTKSQEMGDHFLLIHLTGEVEGAIIDIRVPAWWLEEIHIRPMLHKERHNLQVATFARIEQRRLAEFPLRVVKVQQENVITHIIFLKRVSTVLQEKGDTPQVA